MMKLAIALFSVANLFALASPALAENSDFSLTYHVERTPGGKLSLESCGEVLVSAAEEAGLQVGSQAYPGQLVVVSGGIEGKGAFVAQCIAVNDMTVTVVQGIDYRPQKGVLGSFADKAFDALKAAVN